MRPRRAGVLVLSYAAYVNRRYRPLFLQDGGHTPSFLFIFFVRKGERRYLISVYSHRET